MKRFYIQWSTPTHSGISVVIAKNARDARIHMRANHPEIMFDSFAVEI